MISVPQLHLEFFWDYLHYSHLAFYVLGKVDLCPFFVCWVKKMQGITEILFTQSILGKEKVVSKTKQKPASESGNPGVGFVFINYV